MRYILFPHGGSGNHGCEAIVRSTKLILDGDLELYSNATSEDLKYGLQDVCSIIKPALTAIHKDGTYVAAQLRRLILGQKDALDCLAFRNVLNAGRGAAAYLSIGGDNYCYGMPRHIMLVNRHLKKQRVPMILWGCSIEPDSMRGELLEDLRLFDLIIARESLTYDALKEHGISKAVLCPDPAFVMKVGEPILPDGFDEGNTVAINVSPMARSFASGKSELLIKNYERLIAWILRNTDMKVALLPHVVWSHNDDREALALLAGRFADEPRVVEVVDQNAEQLKGVISKCSFLVAARTHASIAAYSTCVPTLVLGYSVKAKGIAKDLFGTYDGYVKPVQNLQTEDDITHAFEKLMDKESEVRAHLQRRMPQYRERVMSMAAELRKALS